VQYSIVTSDFTCASFIFFTLCARECAVEAEPLPSEEGGDPFFSGTRESRGRVVETDRNHCYAFHTQTNGSFVMAVIEQAGIPALRIAFTIAVIVFLFGGYLIFRWRH